MKTPLRLTVFSLILAAAAVVHAAAVPGLDVVVANPAGKVVFKGKTAANGSFATAKLEPGNYVVQFNSKDAAMKSSQFAIVVSAGKKKVTADSVSGEKLGKGGVAMRVDVGSGLNITGQVVTGGVATASNAKVKVVNGKRYVWEGPETGSNMGGRWVEEGTTSAPRSNVIRSATLQTTQNGGGGR